MIIGTAGHIDHGKTALVRALTGVDTDRLPEERRRGITIDLGFAPLRLPGGGVAGMVDVPGHEAFVRTMVAGATGIDVALLVVAADEGVMPQTREHLAVLRLLGVTRGVVAITKCDLVDDEWLALARDDVRAILADTPLRDAPILAVSARSGAGIDALREALASLARDVQPRDEEDLARLPVDRVFTVKGTGTVVTGTLWSGRIRRDDLLRLHPGNREVRVRALQQHGDAVDEARPGVRIAAALAGVELSDLERGAVLVAGEGWLPTSLLRADVTLLTDAIHVGPRTRLQLHLGTREVSARLVARGAIPRDGSAVPVRVALDEPVVARAGDRFVLRAPAPLGTVGGGVVTDPHPPRRARPWPAAPAAAERLRLMAVEAGAEGLDRTALAIRLGLTPAAAERLASKNPGVARAAGRLWDPAIVEAARATLVDAVGSHHSRFPLEPNVPVNLLRTVAGVPAILTDHLVAELVRAGTLEEAAGGLRMPGWKPGLAGGTDAMAGAIRERLGAAGLQAPTAAELARELPGDPVPVLRYLEREGELTQVAEGWWLTKRSIEELVALLRVELEREREYTPAELRDRLGLSRKFLIPILEYCDRAGVTVRRGNNRVLRSVGDSLMRPPVTE